MFRFTILSLLLLQSGIIDAQRKACTPDDFPLLRNQGKCTESIFFQEFCLENKFSLSVSKDCVSFDGSWCCYDNTELAAAVTTIIPDNLPTDSSSITSSLIDASIVSSNVNKIVIGPDISKIATEANSSSTNKPDVLLTVATAATISFINDNSTVLPTPANKTTPDISKLVVANSSTPSKIDIAPTVATTVTISPSTTKKSTLSPAAKFSLDFDAAIKRAQFALTIKTEDAEQKNKLVVDKKQNIEMEDEGDKGYYRNHGYNADRYQGPFASVWDREHHSRSVYDNATYAWVQANLALAWNVATGAVEGKNAQYYNNSQCGYSGNPYDSTETRNQLRAEVLTIVAQWLWNNYPNSTKEYLYNAMYNLNPYDYDFLSDCLAENYVAYKDNCSQYHKYSRPDQICNNIAYPKWGAHDDIGVRITDIWNYDGGIWGKQRDHVWAKYDEPYDQLMGEKQLADLLDKSQKECYNFDVTVLHSYFAQFVTHDIIKSAPYTVTGAYGQQVQPHCCNVNPSCLHHSCRPVPVVTPNPNNYSTYAVYCMDLVDNVPGIDYCRPQAKDNRNLQTAYIDGSAIYGATCERSAQLRSYSKGQLKVNKRYQELYYTDTMNLPDDPNPDPAQCDNSYHNNAGTCVMAGDIRANQHPSLTAWHTVWLRLHNRIAASCAEYLNKYYLAGDVLDEICYQETRRYVQAILQNIFYRDHLPVELGTYVTEDPAYGLNLDVVLPYNPHIHASAWPEYTYAAGRQHNLISHWTEVQDPVRVALGYKLQQSWYGIHDFFHRGYELVANPDKMKELFANSLYENEKCYDTSFVSEMRAGYGTSGYKPGGLDMFVVNLARGREFGVPWYTQMREFCGMSPVYDWEDLEGVFHRHCLDTLPDVYENVKNIEGYVGMNCEIPMSGAVTGPTAGCILQRQYQNLREGDRFFFDRNGLTEDQMRVVKKFDIGKILCKTTNLTYVTENVFRRPNDKTNKVVSCKDYDDVTTDDYSRLWTTSPTTAGDYRTCKNYVPAYGPSSTPSNNYSGQASYGNAGSAYSHH